MSIDLENPQQTHYSVCGTSPPYEYLNHMKSCFNKSYFNLLLQFEHRERLSVPCPWPKASVFQMLDSDRTTHFDASKVYPIPGADSFRNFSVQEAYQLLKGKTIVLGGDSSSRRLMWAFCSWLAQNSCEPVAVDGKKQYGRVYCNLPMITRQLNILLVYEGALGFAGLNTFLGKVEYFSDLRRFQLLQGQGINSVLSRDMPKMKKTKAVHFFIQTINHHVEKECLFPAEELLKNTTDCGFDEYFTEETKAIVRNFHLFLC